MASSDFQPDMMKFTPTYHNNPYPYISPTKASLPTTLAVLISGASRGIGLATAHSYAAAGASRIAIAARQAPTNLVSELQATAKSAGRKEPEILALSLDVTDEKSVAAAAKEIETKFGRLDVLVNNAGYLEPFKNIADSDPMEWWRVYDVNVRGVYLVTRALLPLLIKTDNGLKTILNVSSVGALIVSKGASGYQTGKLALCRLGEFVMEEYGDQGVLCFAIHPGGVPTQLAKSMPEAMHGLLTDEPELAGDSIVWLTGEKREWLAGRYVSVNWDMEQLSSEKERIVKEDLLKFKLGV